MHQFFSYRSTSGILDTIYLQLDNCSRENKNRFLMAYVESLVAWGMVEEVLVGFLPVGHSHEDIDQAFSCTSRLLAVNDAISV